MESTIFPLKYGVEIDKIKDYEYVTLLTDGLAEIYFNCSRSLNQAGKAYSTLERKILSFVDVLKVQGHLFCSQNNPLEIVTDHANATQIDKLKIRCSRHISCMDQLSQHRFVILCAKGTGNRMADALSRLHGVVREL
jgi:RNase H-like domain found in reverse transcriptase